MIDFLILYEHKAREYDGVCLLKMALERKGYSVAIEKTAKLSYLKYLKKKNKPRVIITYSLYDDSSIITQVTSVAWNVKKIVNLQWEQVFTYNARSIALHTPKETAIQAVHICWGEDCEERLRRRNVKWPVRTGYIHLDFMRPEFYLFYKSRSELEKRFGLPNGRMILYISSFTQVEKKEKEINILKKKLGDGFINNLEKGMESRRITLEWLDILRRKDENNYIIYRPHPGENVDSELEKRIEEGRFFVIREDSVKQWIYVADYIYTWVSTSIVEVFFAKKHCAILRPIPVERKYDIQMFDGANIITTKEQLCSEYGEIEKKFPISKESINTYYQVDSKFSYQKIVELLEAVLHTDKYDINHYPVKLYIGAIKVIINRLVKSIIFKLHITSSTVMIKRMKKFSKWLDFFYYYQKKEELEVVTEEERIETEKKLSKILEKIEH